MRKTLLAFVLALIPCAAGAVVIRDDVPDVQYRLAASAFPALVDLPEEGHGVLIAPQWVVTAAHAVAWQKSVDVVTIGGTPRAVRRLIMYPGYQQLPQPLIEATLRTGETAAVTNFLHAQNDIALLELAQPVTDVAPATIDKGDPAVGTVIEIIGKGATGTGISGQGMSHRTDLRHAYAKISAVDGRWLCYRFNAPPSALPLEGSSGSGDSGGPVIVERNGRPQVAALASWKLVLGDARKFEPGKYGMTTYNVRPGYYLDWIDRVTGLKL